LGEEERKAFAMAEVVKLSGWGTPETRGLQRLRVVIGFEINR